MNVCFSIDFFMECEFEEFNEFTPVTAFFDFNYNPPDISHLILDGRPTKLGKNKLKYFLIGNVERIVTKILVCENKI